MTKWTLCPHFLCSPYALLSPLLISPLVVLLAVAMAVIVALEEEVLVTAVRRKSNGCDAQAREARLEAVPPREPAAVAPCLTVGG